MDVVCSLVIIYRELKVVLNHVMTSFEYYILLPLLLPLLCVIHYKYMDTATATTRCIYMLNYFLPFVTNLTKIVILRINFIPSTIREVMANVSQDICEYRWYNGVVGSCVAHDISCHHRERNTKLFLGWFNWQHV